MLQIQNKHIIRLSFIGLFLIVVANIVLYRYFMIEEVVIKQMADYSVQVANVYKSRIWDGNENAVKKIKSEDYLTLLTDQDFINFAKSSSDYFKNTNSTVIVYDKSGKNLFTNISNQSLKIQKFTSSDLYDNVILALDKYFLQDYVAGNHLTEAYRGKTSHSLISRAIVIDEDDNRTEKSFIVSYIPIITSASGDFSVEGMVEITTDITDQWDNITYLEKRIFVSFVVVFIIFFAIVMYNTNYAQRIINKQFETNRALKEAKIRAETESSAKTEFLANISHELRTPLNAIIGFSEIMIAETYGKVENKQYKDYITDINNSGKHLLSVINDILDFSKASADKLNVEKVELDLNKLASSSMRFVKPRADEAGVRLIEELPTEHIIIVADPKRLKQALLNLLSNSVKFTPTDGSVTLSIRKDINKKKVLISVVDTGIGMSDKDIPKALSSFGQVDNKLSRKYEGTGLGLPLTKKLVELMNGKFDIRSAPGKGTTVTIEFEYSKSIEI